MQFPRIHINGSDPERLRDDYIAASSIAQRLLAALQDTTPHGRDYYLISSDAASVAMSEHVARLAKVEDVCRELHALAFSVIDQKETK